MLAAPWLDELPILEDATDEGAIDESGADDAAAEEGAIDETAGAWLEAVTGVELGLALLDPPPPPPQAVINPVRVRPINSLDSTRGLWFINRSY